MSKAKGKYCVRCFADIQQADVVSFTDSGLCDACFQAAKRKQRASEERQKTQIPPVKSYKSDNEITADVFIIGFACLFFIGPADLIFDFDLEYGFFMFLRLTAFFGFAYLAYQNWESEYKLADLPISYIFTGLAVLYNPFISVSLTREIWTPINIATGVLVFMFLQLKNKKTDGDRKNQTSVSAQPISPVSAPPIKGTSRSSVWENKKPTSTEFSTNKKQEASKKRDFGEIISLITDPLMFQKTMMKQHKGYLDSISALGYVGGYTDAFLQKSGNKFDLNVSDEELIMASVLGIIFENTKHGPEDYFNLQGENNADFIDGQMAGGNNAFKMLAFAEVDPRNKKHRMGWLSHYNEWLETSHGLEESPAAIDNEKEKVTFDGPPEPDLYSSLMVGDPGQICDGFQSMQQKTKGLYLQAKDTGSAIEFVNASIRQAGLSSVSIFGCVFFLVRMDQGITSFTSDFISRVIYSDLLYELTEFSWVNLHHTIFNFKQTDFNSEEIQKYLNSEEVTILHNSAALAFLVPEQTNKEYAHEKLKHFALEKEKAGILLDGLPTEKTRNMFDDCVRARLVGNPTEYQSFNANFQQDTFKNVELGKEIAKEIRKGSLYDFLEKKVLEAL